MKAILTTVLISALISGCGSNKAMFFTSSSLSILEGDTKPVGLSIGYKRLEGYIGPNNADGSAPPLIGTVESDGRIFNPKIRQLYATGSAAVSAASGKDCAAGKTRINERKYMYFGTSTNMGLSLGTTGNTPDSFSFGYKRKEFSYIPLVQNSDKSGYIYPSVLASIDTIGSAKTQSSDPAFLKTSSLFATGDAACELSKDLRPEFLNRVESIEVQQQKIAVDILKCYPGVALANRLDVWSHANKYNLFREKADEKGTAIRILKEKYNNSVSDGKISNANQLFYADKIYTTSIAISDNELKSRVAEMNEHKAFVCSLSSLNK